MTGEVPASPLLKAAVEARGGRLAEARPLAGDGSDRSFFRIPGEAGLVLLLHPHPPGRGISENDSYFLIGRHLRSRGVPVPEIYDFSREEGWMLLEDVGDLSLADGVAAAAEGEMRAWYRRALEVLVLQQLEGARGFDPAWCFDTPAVTRSFLLARECRYFLQAFLQGYLGLGVEEGSLAPDFHHLLTRARPEETPFFLHRDFQSKNLFIQGEDLRVLDFQGARLGPLGYDLAALLIDPYVDLSAPLQEELLTDYLDLLAARLPFDQGAFREQFPYLALCRNLQMLGAFAFLTRVKQKNHFAAYIPRALAGLRRRLAARGGEFPRLKEVVGRIVLPGAGPEAHPEGETSGLGPEQ